MRKIERVPLSEATIEFLWSCRLEVVQAGEAHPKDRTRAQQEQADRLWNNKVRTSAFDEIKEKLSHEMAPGHGLCMYCEGSAGSDIEHFRPRNTYPTRSFEWENHLWSCSPCNRYKGTQFPLDARGLPLLIDPTRDDPAEHLTLAPCTGKLDGRTPKGTTTIHVLRFHLRSDLDRRRAMTWRSVQRLLIDFDDSVVRADFTAALAAQKDLSHYPHASVLNVLIETLTKPGGALLIQEKRCIAILERYPEIRDWV